MQLAGPELSRRAWLACLAILVAAYAHHTLPYLTMMPRVNVDEPWVLERASEVVRTGRPLQPMLGFDRAYLLQPGYSYLVAPWLAIFGLGIFQARLFGVLLGLGIILAVAGIGARLAGRTAGLFAASFLLADSNFLGGVRNARTDIPAVFFIALSLWLFLVGRDSSRSRWYFLSGVASAAAMLCHGNSYWVALILFVWLVIDRGRRFLLRPDGYAYAAGLAVALSPYLIVVAVEWTEVQRQIASFAGDRVPGWRPSFIWQQMQLEPERYRNWYFGLITNEVPNPLLRAFQASIVAGLAYLMTVAVRGTARERRNAGTILTLAAGAALVFAGFINNKAHVYMPNLLIGFAVVAGTFAAWSVSRAAALLVGSTRRAGTATVAVAAIALYTAAGVVYYEKWYSITRRSELVPYERTARTIDRLLPDGPKVVFASPHFWVPFAGRSAVSFYSYTALVPDGSAERIWQRWVHDSRPMFLLIDERQWKPELTSVAGDRSWQHAWLSFIAAQCRVRGYAPATAYGTLAAYECAPSGPPPERPIFLAGDAGVYMDGESLVAADPVAIRGWQPYADPRSGAGRSIVAQDAEGVRIMGTRWPGIERTIRVIPGEPYVVTADVETTSEEDVVSIGRWSPSEVTSLSGGSSGGIVEPVCRPDWFPGGHAFIALRPDVRLLFYSERPDAAFTIKRVDVRHLKRVS